MCTIGPSIHDTDTLSKLLEVGMVAGEPIKKGLTHFQLTALHPYPTHVNLQLLHFTLPHAAVAHPHLSPN
jgi:hypothetical protein